MSPEEQPHASSTTEKTNKTKVKTPKQDVDIFADDFDLFADVTFAVLNICVWTPAVLVV